MTAPQDAPDSFRRVRLIGMPATLYAATRLHTDELLHELELVAAGAGAGTAHPPTELVRLMDEILSRHAGVRRSAWEDAQAAMAGGAERIDLEVAVPPEVLTDARRLVALLEEADELCRRAKLLTLAATPEMAALRRWVVSELEAQLERGAPPTPWS